MNKKLLLIYTGDQVAHRVDKGFVNGTTTERALMLIRSTCQAVQKVFPDKPFLPSFGNNDLPGNYMLPDNSSFYESVLKIWKPLILCGKCQLKVTTEKELEESFLKGGYYKADIKCKCWFLSCYKLYNRIIIMIQNAFHLS